MAAKASKSLIYSPYSLIAGIDQSFYVQIIRTLHKKFALYRLACPKGAFQTLRLYHQPRNTAVNDASGQTVDPFSHTPTTCVFLLCFLLTFHDNTFSYNLKEKSALQLDLPP